jgi:hypothetical protein
VAFVITGVVAAGGVGDALVGGVGLAVDAVGVESSGTGKVTQSICGRASPCWLGWAGSSFDWRQDRERGERDGFLQSLLSVARRCLVHGGGEL